MLQSDEMTKALSTVLKYLPQIYAQREISDNVGEIIINYPHKELPSGIILYVLPYRNSIEENINTPSQSNVLTIKYHTTKLNPDTNKYELTSIETKKYSIFVEGTNGTKRPASSGDILADRLCMFRFSSKNSPEVILCNSPMYGNIFCNTLEIGNDLRLYKKPVIGVKGKDGFEVTDTLVTQSELKELQDKVNAIDNRIKVGVQTPEQYFSANPNAVEGTIYLQMEDN